MTDQQRANFAHNIKIARFLIQISAHDLAKSCGFTPLSRISSIEEMRGKPTLDEFLKICEVLGQPIESMINKRAKITIQYE